MCVCVHMYVCELKYILPLLTAAYPGHQLELFIKELGH